MQLKSFAVKSHQGPLLNINEDAQDCDLENGLFMILDGIGGSGIGDKTVKKIIEDIKQFYLNAGGDRESTMPYYYSPKYLIEGNALINALLLSHKNQFELNKNHELHERGAASGVICALSENILTIISVGNCQSYLIRRGNLEKLFVEDTLLNVSQDQDKPNLRTCPTNAIGFFEHLDYQIKEIKMRPSDLFCFISDGVYSYLTRTEVKFILTKSDDYLMKKIEELTELNNSRGNLDNQTVLLLQF